MSSKIPENALSNRELIIELLNRDPNGVALFALDDSPHCYAPESKPGCPNNKCSECKYRFAEFAVEEDEESNRLQLARIDS